MENSTPTRYSMLWQTIGKIYHGYLVSNKSLINGEDTLKPVIWSHTLTINCYFSSGIKNKSLFEIAFPFSFWL